MIRSGDKDFRAILGTLPKDIDLIYASLWAPDAALLVKQLPDVGLEVRVIGPDGQYEPVDYIEASAGAAEGNYVSFLVPDLKKVPTATAFVEAFEAEYGPVSSYGPLAYEATNIILSAIEKVGTLDRAAIRDAVRATENYTGILGFPITFDDKGDVRRGQRLHLPGAGPRLRAGGLRQPEVSARRRGAGRAMALLEACRLSKRFGGLQAFRDLDLTVAEGEILGLIGPNGSGKTTFFNAVTGLHPATGGRILFADGAARPDPAAAAPDHRARDRAHLPEPALLQPDDGARERARRHALPDPERARQHRRRHARRARRAAPGAGGGARAARPSFASASRRAPDSPPPRCPTPTGGGSRSRARSPRDRASCSSTSRQPA